MARQFRFFSIPVKNSMDAEMEMNQFLGTVRVSKIDKALIGEGENAFYTIAVEYESVGSKMEKKSYSSRVDYREVLSQEDFALFTKLRDWRMETAKKENVKAYVIFTDAQLAEIAEKRPKTREALLKIPGIGESRVKKYRKEIFGFMMDKKPEKESGGKEEE